MSAENTLGKAFADLGLPRDAVAFLLMLWHAIQVIDDVADKDPVARADARKLAFNVLVGIPSNAFWAANAAILLPALSLMVLRWVASDDAELDGNADARSYGWRASYYDVVLLVVQICRGADFAMAHSAAILGLYGESFDSYLKEFDHA